MGSDERALFRRSVAVTLLDVVRAREAILKRIKGARIGVGSNKPGWYDDPRHRAYGKARRRRAEWALKLEKAKEDLVRFDEQLAKIEIGEWEAEPSSVASADGE